MTFEDAIAFIASTRRLGSKFGLARIRALLAHLGDPHHGLKYVHVAGTNGKGSTVAYIANILMQANYRTGIFISPYVHRFNESICVNGEEIPDAQIARIIGMIHAATESMAKRGEALPTEFEIVTALAFQYYRDCGCDIVVLETGLGGRLDSTNIIDTPEVAVITAIDYDHTHILGETLAEIAFKKAGIIKDGGRVVLYPQASEADAVIARVCLERNAALLRLDASGIKPLAHDLDGQSFDFGAYHGLRLSMLSGYQCLNAAMAVRAAEVLNERGFAISETHIRDGLLGTRWPGRFEVLCRAPVFIVDSAHNAQGARLLADNLRAYFPNRDITFLAGVSSDKDYHSVIGHVLPLAKRFIAMQATNARALPAEELAGYLRGRHKEVYVSEKPSEAVALALRLCAADAGHPVVCSFGSLFHVGEVRGFFGCR